MEEIKAPKKERKFLKAIGNIGKVLAEELIMGIARKFIGKAIDKVGNKKQGLVIAFLLVAGISYASMDSIPYPITGNKQRLGWQTSGNGLVWRGRATDTITKPTSYADKNVKAYLILDSVSGSLYVFKQGSWAAISGGGTTIDTTSLSNRINLKVNISDTAAMLLPYFRDADTSTLNLISRFALKLNISDTASMLSNYALKSYADTSGRFYARQDFRNVSSSTLTWTQTDTLVVNDTTSLQVYRNGQILLPSQYTVPTKTSVVIGSTAYKLGENYTVILPRGGGGGGSGSGSLTSISGGTGITVSPNPITTTGTVSADLSVLMELTDTTLLNLTTRFATKQNNITLTTTGTSGASTLVGSTLNIPQYTGGSGTVTSVGSGYGILGGPITTTGTLRVDSSTVYDFVRDSIVAVEIGGDTIKIIKQEYTPATSDTLTFTILPKFPIQLRQFILLFRNGQLLLNDQFTVIDTNKVKIAATSYKVGENYTLVTVSGIGSVSSAQGNPIYPEAGIALSTGTTWTSSITNNSSNWNTAFTDRLKWDGGSTGLVAATGRTSLGGTTIGQSMFTLTNPSAITFPQFNADNSVSALSAASFRSAIGAGTVTSVTVSGTSGNPLSISNTTTTPVIELLSATSGRNGYLTSTDWTTFNNKQSALGFTPANSTITIATNAPLQGGGDLTANRTLSITQATTTSNGFLTSTDWNTFNNKGSGNITGNGSNLYFPIFSSSANITQSLLRWDGNSIPNSTFINDYNFNQFSALAGSGTRMVVASSTGLLSTQTIGTSVTSFSAGTTGLTPNTASTGEVTLSGTLALTNGGTGGTSASTARTGLGATVRGANVFTLPDIDQVSFIRYNANNTISQRTAEGIRIDLGGTTIGQNMFMLTNPSAITFPRFNADNTVNALSAADFRTAIGVTESANASLYISRTGTSVSFVEDLTSYSVIYLKLNNNSTITVTLPTASLNTNKSITIKNIGTGAVNSNASNVEPLNSSTLSSVLLVSGGGKFTTVVSDGSNWIKMAGN